MNLKNVKTYKLFVFLFTLGGTFIIIFPFWEKTSKDLDDINLIKPVSFYKLNTPISISPTMAKEPSINLFNNKVNVVKPMKRKSRMKKKIIQNNSLNNLQKEFQEWIASGKKKSPIVPHIKIEDVSCKDLFSGNPFEINVARRRHKDMSYESNKLPPETQIPQLLSSNDGCEFYKSYKGFIKEPLNDEEANFPIAYSMLIYKDYEQFIRLFRAVYRPQNYYCIHIDKKTDSNYKSNVEALVRCFPNGRVFVAPISYDVQWATFTVLQPELDCMRELWNRFAVEDVTVINLNNTANKMTSSSPRSKKRPLWKYFINLTGQEYPLRTNWELIQILKIFDGANNVEGTFKRMHSVIRMYHAQNHPPRGIIIWKGSVHVVLSRAFVDFALHHPISIALQNYLKDIFVPDEYFFSTLNNNPNFGVPGSYNGSSPETDPVNNRFIARFKNWGYPPFAWPCKGKWVRQICNFGVGDLPLLASRDELFANKFDYEFEPLAYNCMEELLFNRTRLEYANRQHSQEKEEKVMSDDRNVGDKKGFLELTTDTGKKMTNVDHQKFKDLKFATYGDEEDGTFVNGDQEIMLHNYLVHARSSVHDPGVVEMEHYKKLEFVTNHIRVADDWMFSFDDGYVETKVIPIEVSEEDEKEVDGGILKNSSK